MTGAMAPQASPFGETGSQQVNPADQAKGAIQVVSKLRTSNREQLEGIATQFPSVSKEAKDLLTAFDNGLQGLVKKIIETTRIPEGPGPRVTR